MGHTIKSGLCPRVRQPMNELCTRARQPVNELCMGKRELMIEDLCGGVGLLLWKNFMLELDISNYKICIGV